jgi:hypothetical protein
MNEKDYETQRREPTSEKAASIAPGRNEVIRAAEPKSDEMQTDQSEAFATLVDVRDRVFDGSNELLALALRRPVKEIQGWLNGKDPIDRDVVLTARTLARVRGVQID